MKRALFRVERTCANPRVLLDLYPQKLKLTEPIPGEEEFGPRLSFWYPCGTEWAVVSLLSQGCETEATLAVFGACRLAVVKLTVEFRVTPTRIDFLWSIVDDYDAFKKLAIVERHPVVLVAALHGDPDLLVSFMTQLAVSRRRMKICLYAETEPGMTREVWRTSALVRWGTGAVS